MIELHGGETVELWRAVVLGIVEGVTEFLPISSTGHLILADALLGRSDPAFEVAIQAGAITAILVRYGRDLLRALRALLETARGKGPAGQPTNLLLLILIAATPAALIGVALGDWIKERLFDPRTVGCALLVGGVALLAIERWVERGAAPPPRVHSLADIRPLGALLIGAWQVLALIPGTSRSGATIAGGLLGGFSRAAAAEFSFLVGLPILYGACALEVLRDLPRFTGPLLPAMLLASAVAFVTAWLVVDAFVRFLQRHTFRPFGYYRIAAGGVVLWLSDAGVLQ